MLTILRKAEYSPACMAADLSAKPALTGGVAEGLL